MTPPPPKQMSKRQNVLSAKNPLKNNKNHAKKLKMYGQNVDFQRPTASTPENVLFVHL